ncbi:MAG TPA: 4'-phosphopantetheinyl transferase superfamily protein [Puia sp.]
MSSTGNDIVALAAIDKQRTHHSRFYSKILSDAERALFDRLQPVEMPFENFVWLLWSVKESVYKYLKRTEPGLVFSPIKIGIQCIDPPSGDLVAKLPGNQWEGGQWGDRDGQWESREAGPGNEFYKGIALFESRIFYFRSKIHPEYISTVVNEEENFENIWWGVKSIDRSDYAHQSAVVRAFVLNRLNAVCGDHLQIGKSPVGYPIVLKDAEEMKIPVSFAHHGRYIAYSFLLANS